MVCASAVCSDVCRVSWLLLQKIAGCPETRGTKAESLIGQIEFLKHQLERRRQKVSKVTER